MIIIEWFKDPLGSDRTVLDLQLHVQSVPITTEVEPHLSGGVINTILYDKVCQCLVFGRFLRVPRFPPPIKLTTMIYICNWNILECGVKNYTLPEWFYCDRQMKNNNISFFPFFFSYVYYSCVSYLQRSFSYIFIPVHVTKGYIQARSYHQACQMEY